MEPIVPEAELPFVKPSTVQVTFGLGLVVSTTVRAIGSVALILTVEFAGVIATLTGVIVTVALPAKYFCWALVMCEETARMVTVGFEGTVAGAVYVPVEALMVPHTVTPVAQTRLHVTVAVVELKSRGVLLEKVVEVLVCTLIDGGLMDSPTGWKINPPRPPNPVMGAGLTRVGGVVETLMTFTLPSPPATYARVLSEVTSTPCGAVPDAKLIVLAEVMLLVVVSTNCTLSTPVAGHVKIAVVVLGVMAMAFARLQGGAGLTDAGTLVAIGILLTTVFPAPLSATSTV